MLQQLCAELLDVVLQWSEWDPRQSEEHYCCLDEEVLRHPHCSEDEKCVDVAHEPQEPRWRRHLWAPHACCELPEQQRLFQSGLRCPEEPFPRPHCPVTHSQETRASPSLRRREAARRRQHALSPLQPLARLEVWLSGVPCLPPECWPRPWELLLQLREVRYEVPCCRSSESPVDSPLAPPECPRELRLSRPSPGALVTWAPQSLSLLPQQLARELHADWPLLQEEEERRVEPEPTWEHRTSSVHYREDFSHTRRAATANHSRDIRY